MEVTLTQVEELLDLIVNEGPRRVTCNIEGPAGVGKSSIVRQFCEKRGYPLVEINTASVITEPGDILGMPMKDGEQTVYAPVFWALQANQLAEEIELEEGEKKVILMFDDFNRVPAQLLQSMMSVFLDYKVGSLNLANSVRIVLTGNPAGTHEYAARALDKAQADRIQSIKIRFDLDTFLEYAISREFNEHWTAFCKVYPEIFESITPRAAEFASQALNALQLRGYSIESETARMRLDSIVGESIRASFMSFLKTQTETLPPEDIIAGNINENVFEKMLTRSDLLHLTYVRLAFKLAKTELSDQEMRNVQRFLVRVNQDEVTALFLMLLSRRNRAVAQRLVNGDVFEVLRNRLKALNG